MNRKPLSGVSRNGWAFRPKYSRYMYLPSGSDRIEWTGTVAQKQHGTPVHRTSLRPGRGALEGSPLERDRHVLADPPGRAYRGVALDVLLIRDKRRRRLIRVDVSERALEVGRVGIDLCSAGIAPGPINTPGALVVVVARLLLVIDATHVSAERIGHGAIGLAIHVREFAASVEWPTR